MRRNSQVWIAMGAAAAVAGWQWISAYAQQPAAQPRPSSYASVNEDKLDDVIARMTKAKPDIAKKHNDLLNSRYDMANKTAKSVTMSKGKPIQEGVRVKLNQGTTWDSLASQTPEQVKEAGTWPKGF